MATARVPLPIKARRPVWTKISVQVQTWRPLAVPEELVTAIRLAVDEYLSGVYEDLHVEVTAK